MRGVTIEVTKADSFNSEVSTRRARIKNPTTRDLNSLIEILPYILPFVISVASVSCMSMHWTEKERDNMVHWTFVSIWLYHFVMLYMHHEKGGIEAIARRVWLDINFHYMILAGAVYLTKLRPVLFFTDYAIFQTLNALQVIDTEIAPRTGEGIADEIQKVIRPIIHSDAIQKLRVFLQIMLLPYMIIKFISTMKIRILLCALVDLFLFILMAYRVEPSYRCIEDGLDRLRNALRNRNRDELERLLSLTIDWFNIVSDHLYQK